MSYWIYLHEPSSAVCSGKGFHLAACKVIGKPLTLIREAVYVIEAAYIRPAFTDLEMTT